MCEVLIVLAFFTLAKIGHSVEIEGDLWPPNLHDNAWLRPQKYVFASGVCQKGTALLVSAIMPKQVLSR